MDPAAEQKLRLYLLYRLEQVPLGEVRQLIIDTFGFASGPSFIIGDLAEPAPAEREQRPVGICFSDAFPWYSASAVIAASCQ
jgi:hypothetical protein